MTMLGDYHAGCTIFDIFTTIDSNGAPIVLTGNPAPFLVAYKDAFANAGCTVTGLVLSLNCNGLTGVNAWSVNTELDKAFYACGHSYQVLLRGGTVNSQCVSGYIVARFSLAATSALRPAVPGRCLAMTALGQVEINPCASIFQVTKLVERPITDPCSTIFSVVKMIERPVTDPCSTIFSVVKLIERPVVDSCSAIFSVRKIIDAPVIDACSTVFSVTKTVDVNPCASLFSVQKVIDRPVVDACSAIFSVQKVINPVITDSCSTIFSVQRVVDPDTILDRAIAEPAAVFSWPATLRGIIAWLGAVASNQIKQETGQQGVCDRAVSTTIAKATTTDDGTTATRGSFT